jgi:hypothetical protein
MRQQTFPTALRGIVLLRSCKGGNGPGKVGAIAVMSQGRRASVFFVQIVYRASLF